MNIRQIYYLVVFQGILFFYINAAGQEAPSLDPIPNQVAEVGGLFTYDVDAQSADPPENYELTEARDGMSINPSTGMITWTPASYNDGGLVTVRAYNSAGESIRSFLIFIQDGSDYIPLITSEPFTTATQDVIYTYTLTAEDYAGESVILSAEVLPDWLNFVSATGLLFGTPTNDDVGNHYISLRASDGIRIVNQDFNLTVENVNDPPEFTSTPVTTATENIVYTYSVTATDPDGDDLVYSAPLFPSSFSFDPITRILSGIPTNDDVPTINITIRVSDGTVDVDQEFTITVNDVNTEPVVNSTPATTTKEDTLYSYTISVEDADGDTLTFTFPEKPGWLDWEEGTFTLSGTPSNADVGGHDVSIAIFDGTVTVYHNFEINVTNVNDLPEIMGQNLLSTTEDVAFALALADFNVADVDNDPGELTLVIASGLNYTFSGNLVTPAADYNGNLVVNVAVSDLAGTSPSFEANVAVVPVNDPPVITSEPDETAIINELYSYILTATDPDGDQLLKSAKSVPSFLKFDFNSGILSGTPSSNDLGEHQVALQVADDSIVVPVEFTLTVEMPTGNSEEDFLSSRVYPVPADKYLTVELDLNQNAAMAVFDVEGKQVAQANISAGEKTFQLDVSGLAEGLYVYQIRSGHTILFNSFLIHR